MMSRWNPVSINQVCIHSRPNLFGRPASLRSFSETVAPNRDPTPNGVCLDMLGSSHLLAPCCLRLQAVVLAVPHRVAGNSRLNRLRLQAVFLAAPSHPAGPEDPYQNVELQQAT